MNTAFHGGKTGKFQVSLIIGLVLSALSAFGGTINAPTTSGTPSETLNSSAIPPADYSFPWELSFTSNLGPNDPGFFELGSVPGTFLMSGNTFYNFMGDPTYSTLVFGTSSSNSFSVGTAVAQGTPEPASFWLISGLLLAGACYRAWASPAARLRAQ